MTATQSQRETFFLAAGRHGISEWHAKALLRVAATLDRLAVAACNGDWPCDNGERATVECADCKAGFVRSAIRKDGRCVDCHAGDKARAIVAEMPGWGLELHGDPRGCVVRLIKPDGQELPVPS